MFLFRCQHYPAKYLFDKDLTVADGRIAQFLNLSIRTLKLLIVYMILSKLNKIIYYVRHAS